MEPLLQCLLPAACQPVFRRWHVAQSRVPLDVVCEKVDMRLPLMQQDIEPTADRCRELLDVTNLVSFMDSSSPRPLIAGHLAAPRALCGHIHAARVSDPTFHRVAAAAHDLQQRRQCFYDRKQRSYRTAAVSRQAQLIVLRWRLFRSSLVRHAQVAQPGNTYTGTPAKAGGPFLECQFVPWD
jgi:hypothetical protein